MKLLLGLIAALGMGFTALVNSGQIRVSSDQTTRSSSPPPTVSAPAQVILAVKQQLTPSAAAPHPAAEAQAKAMQIYPGLALKDSAINQKFVSLYREAKESDPALLAQSDWPLQLAHRAMADLGGTPYAQAVSKPSIPGLTSFITSESSLNAPAKPAARVRHFWETYYPYPYYYTTVYTSYSSINRFIAGRNQSSARSTCASNSGSNFQWSPLSRNTSPYRSRLETSSYGGSFSPAVTRTAVNSGSPRYSGTSRISYSNPTSGSRGPTISASQPSANHCSAAPSAASAGPRASTGFNTRNTVTR